MIKYAVFILIILSTNSYSQLQFASQTIVGGDRSAAGTWLVYAVDVERDGDVDVLSTSENNKIVWFKNQGPADIGENDPSVVLLKTIFYNNYPNPFNPTTTITFDLPKSSDVSLKIFNIIGKAVSTLDDGRLSAGLFSDEWSRTGGIVSGVYLYRLQTGNSI